MTIRLESGKEYTGNCIPMSKHIVEVTFDGAAPDPENLGHFFVLNKAGKVFGEYDGYTTLYQEVDGGYRLSDDGSTYVPPADPEPAPEPEPDPGYDIPAGPTLEERVEMIEGAVMEMSEIIYA